MLLQFILKWWCERTKINKKRSGLAHINSPLYFPSIEIWIIFLLKIFGFVFPVSASESWKHISPSVVDVIKLFGGNLDFPKVKKLNKVCCDDWTCTKILTQCYIKLNYIRTLLICSKMGCSCCFSLGGNLNFLD